jgi:hypothetical protein
LVWFYAMLKRELTLLHTKGPLADLAYLRPDQVPRRYPFSKALVYYLLNRGEIKSILLHKPGSVRGIRLISVASIEAYLARLAKEQQEQGFTRAIPKEYNTGRKPRSSGGPVAPANNINTPGGLSRRGRGRPRKEVLA